MNEKMSHCKYIQISRQNLKKIAVDIINGSVDIAQGCNQVLKYRFEIDANPNDKIFHTFIAVASEFDDIPLLDEKLLEKSFFQKMVQKKNELLVFYQSDVLSTAKILLSWVEDLPP